MTKLSELRKKIGKPKPKKRKKVILIKDDKAQIKESLYNSGLKTYEYLFLEQMIRFGRETSLPLFMNCEKRALCDNLRIICEHFGYPEKSKSSAEMAKRVFGRIGEIPEILAMKPFIGTYRKPQNKGTPSASYARELELAEYMLSQGTKRIQVGSVSGTETRFSDIVINGGSPAKFIDSSISFLDRAYRAFGDNLQLSIIYTDFHQDMRIGNYAIANWLRDHKIPNFLCLGHAWLFDIKTKTKEIHQVDNYFNRHGDYVTPSEMKAYISRFNCGTGLHGRWGTKHGSPKLAKNFGYKFGIVGLYYPVERKMLGLQPGETWT